MTIDGGTGAFLGSRGTVNNIACIGCRFASQAEDPSMRRTNGGGRQQTLIQLFPMFRPEVLIGASGPTVFHSDYSLVSGASPARAGETLIVYAKGLGPTTPTINPGDPFPSEPLAIATSPVEVLVNGKSSPAINQVGVPGTTDTYRVDFRVPDDTVAGTATVQLSAAWIKGAPVSIPVRWPTAHRSWRARPNAARRLSGPAVRVGPSPPPALERGQKRASSLRAAKSPISTPANKGARRERPPGVRPGVPGQPA